jgi:hypothetical protein
MLRRTTEVIRVIIISPETVLLLAVWALSLYLPGSFAYIGKRLLSETPILAFVVALSSSLLVVGFGLALKVQAPVSEASRELYDWPMYWALKCRIIIAIWWTIVALGLSLFAWFLAKKFEPGTIAAFLLCSILLNISVVISEALALFSLRETLAK